MDLRKIGYLVEKWMELLRIVSSDSFQDKRIECSGCATGGLVKVIVYANFRAYNERRDCFMFRCSRAHFRPESWLC